MPRYEFRCACGTALEARYAIGNAPPTVPCPRCDGHAVRQISVPQLITQPRHLRDENKFANGLSETERTAIRKADEKWYEKSYARVGDGI